MPLLPTRRVRDPRPLSADAAGLPLDDDAADDDGLGFEAAGRDDSSDDGDDLPSALAQSAHDVDADASHPVRTAGAALPGTLTDEASWQELVERIVARDERALAALYDSAGARVYGLALRIVRSAAMAEEVLEDTFWQVWRQAPRFDAARGPVIGWVLAIARSRAIDALRRDARHRHDALPDDDQQAPWGGESIGALDLLEATRGSAQVHAALALLDPRARQLVALAFFRGLTHEDIAAQSQLPLGTVKSLIRRALLQLRQHLGGGPASGRTLIPPQEHRP